jgi:hypothetical protein
MTNLPATVVSRTLQEPLDWPDAAVVGGDAVDVLMAAGLVDRVPFTSESRETAGHRMVGIQRTRRAWASVMRCSSP